MTFARPRPTPARTALAIIFIVLSSSTVAWVLNDKTPPPWDPSDHLSAGYDYYSQIAHLNLSGFAREFFIEPHYYAPLVHLASAAVFLLLGASRLTGVVVNLLSLALLLYSVEWIGRRLYSGSGQWSVASGRGHRMGTGFARQVVGSISAPGVAAALLVACYHFPAWLLHDAFLDYPLIAITAFSIQMLIRADDFTSTRSSIIFGVTAGLGMLTKQTYPFFLALPVAYVTARVLLSRKLRAVLNLILAGATAAATAAVWYAPHLKDVIAIYHVNQQAAISENEAPLFTFMSNAFYVHGLISEHTQIIFGGLFVIGMLFSLVRFRNESILLYLWVLGGLFSFAFVANKDMRYTVPILPAAALLSVCWLGGKKQSGKGAAVFKGCAAALIAVWAFVSFFNAQWPAPGMGRYIDTPRFRWMVFGRNYFGFDHRPLKDDWGVPEVVRAVEADARLRHVEEKSSKSARPVEPSESVSPRTHQTWAAAVPIVGVVVNLPYLNPSSVALYARLLSQGRAGNPVVDVNWIVVESAKDRVDRCDYIVVRSGLEKAGWVSRMEIYMEELIKGSPARFVKVAEYPIPLQDANVVIYRLAK